MTREGTQRRGSRAAETCVGIGTAGCIALLVLAQGGFFGMPAGLCGIVASVAAGVCWLRGRRRDQGIVLVSLLFVGLCAAYLASALASGLTLTTLSETGAWAACAGLSLWAGAQGPRQRGRSLEALAWFGVVTAVAGALVHAGLIPLAGGMVDGRLQFSFQYANAAAAWYATVTFLCLLAPRPALRSFAALPASALLLTESGGALVAFLAVAAAIGGHWARQRCWERLCATLVQGAIAAAFFAVALARLTVLTVAALLAVACACLLLWRRGEALGRRVDARTVSLVLVAATVVAVPVAWTALAGRVSEAAASFSERLCHVQDGLSLWVSAPLLGVGPDNWQYLYQYVQTAPYYASVVHGSYVQALADAGIVGLACLAGASVVGVRQLVCAVRAEAGAGKGDEAGAQSDGSWPAAALAAASFLLLHSVLEFDLQFSSLALLLALLLSDGSGPRLRARGLLAGVCALALCLPLSLLGLLCASSSAALTLANASGDYGACQRLFLANPLARADVAAQDEYLASQYETGDYEAVVDSYGHMAAPTDRAAIYAAIAHFRQGRSAEASSLLIGRMEAQPYNVEFARSALVLASDYGIEESASARFEAVVSHVSDLTGIDLRRE